MGKMMAVRRLTEKKMSQSGQDLWKSGILPNLDMLTSFDCIISENDCSKPSLKEMLRREKPEMWMITGLLVHGCSRKFHSRIGPRVAKKWQCESLNPSSINTPSAVQSAVCNVFTQVSRRLSDYSYATHKQQTMSAFCDLFTRWLLFLNSVLNC